MQKIWKIIFFISITINLCLLLILFTPITNYLHRLMAIDSVSPQKADVIVILSSSYPIHSENGTMGLDTMLRIQKGVQLFKQGVAPTIIAFSGIRYKSIDKSVGTSMKESLLLYGIKKENIIVHDEIPTSIGYYDNFISMIKKYESRFDFHRAIYITSSDQSYRIKTALEAKLKSPQIILTDPYQEHFDWGKRFHSFRRIANELLSGIPFFYFTGKFEK